MTREEKIDWLCRLRADLNNGVIFTPWKKEFTEALNDVLEQDPTIRNCVGCKYSKDNHNAGTEECHLCMWENQYTPTAKNDLGVDCISRSRAIERLELNFPISAGADNSRDRHRYMQALADIQAIRELPSVTPPEPKIKVLDRNEVSKKLGTVDVYKASAWITLLKDLEYLGLKICEVEE